MLKKLFFSFLFSLSLFNLQAQNCPDYASTATGLGKACGNQIYTMTVPNTGCNGEIYITIETNFANGLGFSWSVESVLTGNTVGSGNNGSATVTIGPINPNTEGNTFDLIISDPGGFGFIPGEYVDASQGGNVLVHLDTPGHSMFATNITISSATITITTPSGPVSAVVQNCNDFIVQVPLANSNFCTELSVDLPWEIVCDHDGSIISSGIHSVTVYPQVPSSANDLVDITWNSTSCSWDISPNNDCDQLDIGNIFDISPDPNSLTYNCASGNESFDVDYLGVTGSPNCCSTAGPATNITYDATFSTSDATPQDSPFGGTNNSAYTVISPNNTGGNATSLSLCVDVTNFCRELINFLDDNTWYVIIFVDGAQVYMSPGITGSSHNVCIDLTDIPGGYTQSSQVEVYILPNTFSAGTPTVYTTYSPGTNCSSLAPGAWNADIDVTFNVQFEEMIGTPVVCTFPLTEAYTSCGSTGIPDVNTTPATCTTDGSSTITNYNPSHTYTFTPSGPTIGAGGVINGATLGQSYDVTATDAGCTSAASTFVNEAQFGNPTYSTAVTDPSCGNNDGEIVISPDLGFIITDYSIDNGTTTQSNGTFSNLGAGTYNVLITDDNGCQATGTITLSDAGGPSIDNVSTTDASCGSSDGTITVTASGGSGTLNYSLDNGQTSTTGAFTGLSAGNYVITVTDGLGCSTNQSITVSSASGVSLTIVNSNDVSCYGADDGSGEVSANGGSSPYIYSWSPSGGNAATATGLPSGIYTVTVTDGGGCSDDVQITINEPDEIIIDETITNSDCGMDNGEIDLAVTGGSGGYTYAWDPNVSTTYQAIDLPVGTYEVTVTDGSGCSKTATYDVILGNSFYIEAIPEETTISQGESVNLNVFIDPNVTIDNISWMPTQGLSCTDCKDPIATPSNSIDYIVTVTDSDGCTSKDTVRINVILPCPDVFVPNTFSPNADGLNDRQCVIGDCIVSLDFIIFNRWGEAVFHTKDQSECWNGRYRGKPAQSGVYIYKLKATLKNGESVEQTGNVTLVR